jgi:hypothetical protein
VEGAKATRIKHTVAFRTEVNGQCEGVSMADENDEQNIAVEPAFKTTKTATPIHGQKTQSLRLEGAVTFVSTGSGSSAFPNVIFHISVRIIDGLL